MGGGACEAGVAGAPYDVARAGATHVGVPGVHCVHVCARVSASTCPAAATAAEAGEEMW